MTDHTYCPTCEVYGSGTRLGSCSICGNPVATVPRRRGLPLIDRILIATSVLLLAAIILFA